MNNLFKALGIVSFILFNTTACLAQTQLSNFTPPHLNNEDPYRPNLKQEDQTLAEYDIRFGSVSGHFIDLGQGVFLVEHGEAVAGIMTDSYGSGELGWGKQASGSSMAPIPSQFYLFWYSLTNDKFYEATFQLPPKKELYEFYQNNFDPTKKVQLILEVPNEEEFFIYFQQGDKRVEYKDVYAELR